MELLPVSLRKVSKSYIPPVMYFCDGTVARNCYGAITEVINVYPMELVSSVLGNLSCDNSVTDILSRIPVAIYV